MRRFSAGSPAASYRSSSEINERIHVPTYLQNPRSIVVDIPEFFFESSKKKIIQIFIRDGYAEINSRIISYMFSNLCFTRS